VLHLKDEIRYKDTLARDQLKTIDEFRIENRNLKDQLLSAAAENVACQRCILCGAGSSSVGQLTQRAADTEGLIGIESHQ
jgi:hypothetical protein